MSRRWTQAAVSQAKAAASTRVLQLVGMTTNELIREYKDFFSPHYTNNRETLLRYLVLEALDRAFPDTGPPASNIVVSTNPSPPTIGNLKPKEPTP